VLALAWERQEDDRQALHHATRAWELYCTLDQPVAEADALNAIGWHEARLGDCNAGRIHCQAALALHQHHHCLDGEAETLDSLAYIAHRTGQHRQAVHSYQQALTLYRALGNRYQSAHTLDRLGHSHIALGEHEHARVTWQEALQLYEHQGRDSDAARIQRQLDYCPSLEIVETAGAGARTRPSTWS
jgi:tetratricopeptide (TPR) repeat protein